MRDEALARDAVTAAVERFGGLDIAFNNAGAMGPSRRCTRSNRRNGRMCCKPTLTSAYLGARHQIPAMLARGGGSLIFTSTFVGYTAGFPGMGAYAASKAGLIGLTQVIASEYGARGIRANALLPGGTDTPMGRDAMASPRPAPTSKTCTHSSAWPRPPRSRARRCTWRRTRPASPPARRCWSMAGIGAPGLKRFWLWVYP